MRLSHVIFRNLGTKLLALAIACVTWFVLSGQRRERISERTYRIPLSVVNVPAGTMIASPLPDAVDVRLRGAFTPLRTLEPSKLEAVVDLLDATPGEKRYPLEPGDINVPRDIEVIAISPAEVRLVLDRVAEKTIPVVPEITGQPAPRVRLEEVTTEPSIVRILGPAKVVAGVASIRTEPVSVEGRDASFSEMTTLAAQPAGVRARDGQMVTVRVRLGADGAPAPHSTPPRPSRDGP